MKTIEELRCEYKKDFQQEATPEEVFFESYAHGAYHEPEFAWMELAPILPDSMLRGIALNSLRTMSQSSAIAESPKRLQLLMRFHDQCALWLRNKLESPTDFVALLDQVKDLMVEVAKEKRHPLGVDALREFSLLHMTVRHRLGMRNLEVDEQYGFDIDDIAEK
jgi:hypothetical protein